MEAIILAGGLGTRLGAIAAYIPKPMVPIGGRPFLALLLDYLESQGVARIVLSVGHLRESITGYFGGRYNNVDIAYAVEESPLGTGGAIARSLRLTESDPVFVLNGDTFLELDYPAMLAAHARAGARLTVAVRAMDDAARYGKVVVEQGRIVAYREKEAAGEGLINGGVYVCSADLFDGYDVAAAFSFERDFLMRFSEKLRPGAFRAEGHFIDLGNPEDYHRAQRELPGVLQV